MSPTSPTLVFRLNGAPVSIDTDAAHATLLDYIRSRGLTGAKEGCAEGECGACTVVLVSPRGSESEYRAVNSCLVPLAAVADHEVVTVEGLTADGTLEDAQQAMAAAGGSQCGYCTPGFVMSLFAEQYRPERDGPCDPRALGGNLCRCTGYRPIRDAALALGAPRQGALLDRLQHPAPAIGRVTAPAFARPASLDDLFDILASHPDATVLAGATDLAVEMNLRGRRPSYLVSLEAISALRTFEQTDAALTIGAALPLTDIGRAWRDAPAAVHEWLDLFASPLIRNRATLGGNLATASPIGDSAPLLAALDAIVIVAGVGGRREVPVQAFFTGYRRTVLAPGEVVAAVRIPLPAPRQLRFYKIAKRRLDDISTVAAALAVDVTDEGRIRRARVALGGVAATPIRLAAAEALMEGRAWDVETVARVQEAVRRTLSPLSDHRGSSRYRTDVTAALVEKFWWETRA